MGEEYSSKSSLANAIRKKYNLDQEAVDRTIDVMTLPNNTDADNTVLYRMPVFPRQLSKDSVVAMIKPVHDINNIYANDDGFKGVMEARQSSTNYPYYDKMAKAIYDNSAKYAGQSWNYEDVKKYNKKMSDNQQDRNILVRHEKQNDDLGGYYDPNNDSIAVRYGDMDNKNYAARHEITHSVQRDSDYRGINALKTIPEYIRGEYDYNFEANQGKLDKYNTSPTELHANIAGIQQAIRSTGIPLKTENDIDKYLDLIINENGTRRPQIKLIDTNGKYINNSNDDESMYKATNALFQSVENNNIIKQGLSRGIPLRKILKSLLMTTAKNEQQTPNQPNSPFTHGMDIS